MRNVRKIAGIMALSLGLTALAPAAFAAPAAPGSGALSLKKIAGYDTGAGLENAGAEIVTYDKENQNVYLINGATSAFEIVDLSDLQSYPSSAAISDEQVVKVPIAAHSPADKPGLFGDVTSIAVHPTEDLIAAAVPNSNKVENGSLVFFTKEGEYIDYVEVGALPDMVTVTPDGSKFLVANEGEPDANYDTDPDGSVSIVKWSKSGDRYSFAATTAVFTEPGIEMTGDIRYASLKTGYVKEPTPEQWAADFEPEYIVVTDDSKTAYVALQESNAIAVLDLETDTFTHVHGLGYKNHMLEGNGLDASDRDDMINIANYPVLGMYMPDGMALKTIGGKPYLFTANEGDSRAYGPDEEITDEVRFKDVVGKKGVEDGYAVKLNADYYPGTTQEQLDAFDLTELRTDEQLGRLTLTNTVSDAVYTDKDAGVTYFNALYAYGARSFSIWDVSALGTGGQQLYDSGDDFEQIVAAVLPDLFNSDHAENAFDNRSDNKGAEPEYVELGEIGGRTYAFVGLERQSGLMVYDVTNPAEPEFTTYVNMRDVAESGKGDLGPEGLKFVAAADSPTGKALLLTGNEVSGTLAVYEIWTDQAFELSAVADEATYSSAVVDGKLRLTVRSGAAGFKTFGVRVSAVNGHEGEETVVFKHSRGGEQLGLVAVKGDFDHVLHNAQAQFNVRPGDIVEAFIVDELTNDPAKQPIVLQ